jgi:tellurite methyltransferase
MTDRFPGDPAAPDANAAETRTGHEPPSVFIAHWAELMASRLPEPRRALDVAMGRGRHARLLAHLGLRTFGVDANFEIVRAAKQRARREGVTMQLWCGDLTAVPLPRNCFDMIVVVRYLQRDLLAALASALTPGGVILYETFTVNQRALGFGPKSPDHLLQPGELRVRFEEMEILFYEEVAGPEAVARLVGRKRHAG